MTTVKEDANTCNIQPTVDHHRDDVFNDVKPSITELPLSNTKLWQQEDLGSIPSLSPTKLSTRSIVNAGTNVENVLSFESSPIPVFCVENRATKNTYLRREPICQREQVSSNEKCLKKEPDKEMQPSETEEMGLDQSLVDYLVSENSDDLDRTYGHIKPLCSNTQFSGEIVKENSRLDDSKMKDFKLLPQEQKQSYSMLSGTMMTNVDVNALHCTRMSEIDSPDIKTEYSDELVPEQSERLVSRSDIKTEYSDELVPEQSERVVSHLDIKTECSDELVPGQSERVVGHLDTMSSGNKNRNKMEDSILTDCDPDDVFNIEQHTKPVCALAQVETAICQDLSTCEEPELGDKVFCGDSYAKDLAIAMQQDRRRSRQTECRKDYDVQTMSLKADVHACKLAFSSNQYLENHMKRRYNERRWTNVKDSISKKRSIEDFNCFENENRTLSKSASCCTNANRDMEAVDQVDDYYYVIENEPLEQSVVSKEEDSFKSDGFGQNVHQSIKSYSNVTHKGEGFVECSGCGQTFSQEYDLNEHMDKMKEGTLFKCHYKESLIEQPFTHKKRCNMLGEYSSHQASMITHSGERLFKCNECDKAFSKSSYLHTHGRTHRGEKPFKCNECGKACSKSSHLRTHMRTHTGEKPFKCNECGKAFSESGHFVRHMRTHTGEKPFQCNDCGKTFRQSGHLHYHMKTHTGKNPLKCYKCDKMFVTNGDLRSHMRTHWKEKPSKCNECGRMFTRSSNLHRHMKTHRGEKPFKCKECCITFSQRGDLQRHMITHTGEKLFNCNDCGMMFSQSSSLHCHMRTHRGEKPFKCNECDRMFSQSSNFHRHMKTHRGEKPFKCNECGTTFSQRGDLQRHMITHTGEKLFKCNECGRMFSRSSSLDRHMKTH